MHFIKMHTGTHKRYNTPALHLRASRTRDANDVCVSFVECTVGGVTPSVIIKIPTQVGNRLHGDGRGRDCLQAQVYVG